MSYAVVKTGGKQYRVEQGQSLLVERLAVDEGSKVTLEPLLYVDGSTVVDGGDGLAKVKVEARVVGHERGPKLRIVKFKPKRGYKRRTGHRQELTRLEIGSIKQGAARSRAKKADAGEPAKAEAPAGAKAEEATKEAAPARAPAKGGAAGQTKAQAPARAKKAAAPAEAKKAAAPAEAKKAEAPAEATAEETTDGS